MTPRAAEVTVAGHRLSADHPLGLLAAGTAEDALGREPETIESCERAESLMIRATLSRVGLRSLAQVLLGMLAFALLIEIWTALSNGDVRVAGAALGVAPLFGAFIVALVALVVISVAGHSASRTRIRDNEETLLYRFSCSQCGWTAEAPTIEQAQDLKRQHRYATHRESS